MAKMCVVNTVCGSPRNEAAWAFLMKESPVDHNYYPMFAPLVDGKSGFGVSCCEACKVEIQRRWSAVNGVDLSEVLD